MAAPKSVEAARPTGSPSERSGFRPDIQGLRVIAVMLVVLFHLWPGAVTGGFVGVDVFFVISGFLITSHLVRRPPASARAFGEFWARRLRRLLPAALLVLAVTLVASRLVAPVISWADTAHEAIASALYVENWLLAAKAVDYLAADATPSAVQQYWSLSVEEQFYLLWPLLVAILALLHRRRGWRLSRLLAAGMGIVFVLSLAYSVWLTGDDPARAYFVTTTRAWEFALGGLAALVATRAARLRGWVRTVLAWAGVAAILWAGLRFTESTPFPGYAALLPTLGTAAVILAATTAPYSPHRLWLLPGVQWTGGASYSIYLWHWPLLVLATGYVGGSLGWLALVGILVATFLLAWATRAQVEDRFRGLAPGARLRRTYVAAVAGMAVVVGLGLLQLVEVAALTRTSREQLQAAIVAGGSCFGAAAIARGPEECPPDPGAPLVPSPALAAEDWPDANDDNCGSPRPFTARTVCHYGTGPVKVALVGNSHVTQWLPALQVIAAQKGWTIDTYLTSECNVGGARLAFASPSLRDRCQAYSRWAVKAVARGGYALIVTSERQSLPVDGEDWAGTLAPAQRAYAATLRAWAKAGASVVVIQDPVPPSPEVGRVPECLSRSGGTIAPCTWPAAPAAPDDPTAYRWMDPLASAATALHAAKVGVVSMDRYLCSQDTCWPVIGTVITYRDASHLTATYARTLAPYLDAAITGVTGPTR